MTAKIQYILSGLHEPVMTYPDLSMVAILLKITTQSASLARGGVVNTAVSQVVTSPLQRCQVAQPSVDDRGGLA
uniref:Uncharacterized protein n=1 Tax=Timema cristinae TaxID=61476 RepID=A0A7R9DHQ0_TIMCR|nr:unnamed protein product [Timema cristinae]